MAGRESKLTEDLQEEIVRLLRSGNYVTTVCDYVGIHRHTFNKWMQRGERGWDIDKMPDDYVTFALEVNKAMAGVEMLTVAEVRSGPMNWQSKAWWLERRHPDRWGNRARSTNTNVNVDLSELSDEDLERLAQGEDIDLTSIASKSRARKKAAP